MTDEYIYSPTPWGWTCVPEGYDGPEDKRMGSGTTQEDALADLREYMSQQITTPGEAFAFIARVYVYVYANARTMIRLARSNAESAARCESYMQALNILHHAGSALIEESE
jgi:hypothetical protein